MGREAPVETDDDGVRARPRRTGHTVADLVLALSAIVISMISLLVAVEHGRTERQLVAASTWPSLEVDTFRTSHGENGTESRLELRNVGVGPARLISMVVRLDGRVLRTPGELLASCCGVPAGTTTDTRSQYGVVDEGSVLGVMEAHRGIAFLGVAGTDNPVRHALEASWPRLRYDGCYCSVLNQCWRSDLSQTGTPSPVASCRSGADDYHD